MYNKCAREECEGSRAGARLVLCKSLYARPAAAAPWTKYLILKAMPPGATNVTSLRTWLTMKIVIINYGFVSKHNIVSPPTLRSSLAYATPAGWPRAFRRGEWQCSSPTLSRRMRLSVLPRRFVSHSSSMPTIRSQLHIYIIFFNHCFVICLPFL